MNKKTKLKLNGATITGPGLGSAQNLSVIAGPNSKGYAKGTLMDANAIVNMVDELNERVDESNKSINTVKEVYNVLEGIQDTAKITDLLDSATPRTKVTYAELMELADNYKLVPGREYQITDYELTINPDRAGDIKSGPGQFDLILTANTEDILDEHGRATWHDGDEYFYDQKIDQWEIWYNAYNDYRVYPWCDYNGKGVIYRMIDESGNDIPYDFKHMMFSTTSTYYFGEYCVYGSEWLLGGIWRRLGDSASPKWCYTFSYQDYDQSEGCGISTDGSLWEYDENDDVLIAPICTNVVVDRSFASSMRKQEVGSFFGYNVFVNGGKNIHLRAGALGNLFINSSNLECEEYCYNNVFSINVGHIGKYVNKVIYRADIHKKDLAFNFTYSAGSQNGRNVYIGDDCSGIQLWYTSSTTGNGGVVDEDAPSDIVIGSNCSDLQLYGGINVLSGVSNAILKYSDGPIPGEGFVYEDSGGNVSTVYFNDLGSIDTGNSGFDDMFVKTTVTIPDTDLSYIAYNCTIILGEDYTNQPYMIDSRLGVGVISNKYIYFSNYVIYMLDDTKCIAATQNLDTLFVDLDDFNFGESTASSSVQSTIALTALDKGRVISWKVYNKIYTGTLLEYESIVEDEVATATITLKTFPDQDNVCLVQSYIIHYSQSDGSVFTEAGASTSVQLSTIRTVDASILQNVMNSDDLTHDYTEGVFNELILNAQVGDIYYNFSVSEDLGGVYIVTRTVSGFQASHMYVVSLSKICKRDSYDNDTPITLNLYSDTVQADPDTGLYTIGAENIQIGYSNKVVESIPSTLDEHTIYFVKETAS